MTVARFNLMLRNAQDNKELLNQVRANCNDGKLPKDMLFKSEREIKDYMFFFLKIKQMDSGNEKFPH